MASTTDKITRISDSDTGRPVIAQLSGSGKSIGATSVTLNAATNWTTTTKIHFAIYTTTQISGKAVKDTSTQTEWTGTLSGTTISNLTLTGGVDQTYLAGAYVELTPTAKYAKDLYDGLAVLHNPDGTFKPGAVSTTATLADSIVTSAKVADGAITAAKLAAGAITLGYAQITTNFSTSVDNLPHQVTGLSVTVTVPGVRYIRITAYTPGLYYPGGNNADVNLSIWDGAVNTGTQLQYGVMNSTISTAKVPATVIAVPSIPSSGSKTYNVGLQTTNISNAGAGLIANATGPAYIHVEAI